MLLRRKKIAARKAVARIAVATAVAGIAALSATGVAAADSKLVIQGCSAMSPNVIDTPYSVQVIESQYKQYGTATFTAHAGGALTWGYDTHVTLNWTNLSTGASGSAVQHSRVNFYNGSTVAFSDVPTGTGPVRIDLSVTNVGLIPVPPVNCSGTVNVDE
ncbi:hypothetical protein [Nocardia sp. NPDC052566]|uniref:hypothetical protein n=1 Tax=Nocardia sp. NPDC052566 TaxID=3364330 RepID=UPI0037C6B9AC